MTRRARAEAAAFLLALGFLTRLPRRPAGHARRHGRGAALPPGRRRADRRGRRRGAARRRRRVLPTAPAVLLVDRRHLPAHRRAARGRARRHLRRPRPPPPASARSRSCATAASAPTARWRSASCWRCKATALAAMPRRPRRRRARRRPRRQPRSPASSSSPPAATPAPTGTAGFTAAGLGAGGLAVAAATAAALPPRPRSSSPAPAPRSPRALGLAAGHLAARAAFERRLGGYTGDCLGATQQLSEAGLYLGIARVALTLVRHTRPGGGRRASATAAPTSALAAGLRQPRPTPSPPGSPAPTAS